MIDISIQLITKTLINARRSGETDLMEECLNKLDELVQVREDLAKQTIEIAQWAKTKEEKGKGKEVHFADQLEELEIPKYNKDERNARKGLEKKKTALEVEWQIENE